MTKAELYTALTGITGFTDKVAYRFFPEGEAPELPYITFLGTYSNNFVADNKVYLPGTHIQVELYTAAIDETTEGLVEACLNGLELPFTKTESWLDDESCYEILYEIEI